MMIEKDKLEKIYRLMNLKLCDEEKKILYTLEMKITIFLTDLTPEEILLLDTLYKNYF